MGDDLELVRDKLNELFMWMENVQEERDRDILGRCGDYLWKMVIQDVGRSCILRTSVEDV